MQEVLVYTTRACAYCVHAKRLLAARGIPYREVDLTFDPATRSALMARTGLLTVPQIFIGEELVGGYDDLEDLDRSGDLIPLWKKEARK